MDELAVAPNVRVQRRASARRLLRAVRLQALFLFLGISELLLVLFVDEVPLLPHDKELAGGLLVKNNYFFAHINFLERAPDVERRVDARSGGLRWVFVPSSARIGSGRFTT